MGELFRVLTTPAFERELRTVSKKNSAILRALEELTAILGRDPHNRSGQHQIKELAGLKHLVRAIHILPCRNMSWNHRHHSKVSKVDSNPALILRANRETSHVQGSRSQRALAECRKKNPTKNQR